MTVEENDFRELRYRLQAVDRRQKAHSTMCEGKHRFASYAQAQSTLRNNLKREAHPYRCPDCKGWHIGNRDYERGRRIAERRAWQD